MASAPLLLIALHGYGGTGRAMSRPLEAAVAAVAPGGAEEGIVIAAPDGPGTPALAAAGRSWFEITSHPAVIADRSREVAPALVEFITGLQQRHGVPARRTCLVGFSQGASVAAAVLATAPVSGRAVLVCGRLPPTAPVRGEPDVLVVNGGLDRFVRAEDVAQELKQGHLGHRVRRLVVPDLGHGFDERAARLTVRHARNDERNEA